MTANCCTRWSMYKRFHAGPPCSFMSPSKIAFLTTTTKEVHGITQTSAGSGGLKGNACKVDFNLFLPSLPPSLMLL